MADKDCTFHGHERVQQWIRSNKLRCILSGVKHASRSVHTKHSDLPFQDASCGNPENNYFTCCISEPCLVIRSALQEARIYITNDYYCYKLVVLQLLYVYFYNISRCYHSYYCCYILLFRV